MPANVGIMTDSSLSIDGKRCRKRPPLPERLAPRQHRQHLSAIATIAVPRSMPEGIVRNVVSSPLLLRVLLDLKPFAGLDTGHCSCDGRVSILSFWYSPSSFRLYSSHRFSL